MSESIEQKTIIGEHIHNDMEKWRQSWLQNAERLIEEHLEDYEAQVKAGLIDPDKLEKYCEIRKEHFEKILKQHLLMQESIDLEETALKLQQQIDYDRFLAAQGTRAYAYYAGCDSWSGSLASDPEKVKCATGGKYIATAKDTKDCAQRLVKLSIKTESNCCSHAWLGSAVGSGEFKYVIPSSVVQFSGRVKVSPYLVLLGEAELNASICYGSMKGSTFLSVKVSTSLYQENKYKGGCGSDLIFFQESQNKNLGSKYPIQKAGLFNKAQVEADVVAGVDVEILVHVTISSLTIGCFWAGSSMKFDDQSHYIQVPFVNVDYLPNPTLLVPEDYNHFPPKPWEHPNLANPSLKLTRTLGFQSIIESVMCKNGMLPKHFPPPSELKV